MNTKKLVDRIVLDPEIMVGKPVIRGTRLTVEFILGLLANGATHEEIIGEYPGLVDEDLQACLQFARQSLNDIAFVPQAAGTK